MEPKRFKAYKVFLGRKEIDKVFYLSKEKITAEEVKESLINHDGYNPSIRVVLER